jgi:hypothetical protein
VAAEKKSSLVSRSDFGTRSNCAGSTNFRKEENDQEIVTHSYRTCTVVDWLQPSGYDANRGIAFIDSDPNRGTAFADSDASA